MTTAPAAPSLKERIESANADALGRLLAADPVLVDVAPAGEVVEGLEGRMILHSGPPITWERMCGAQRGSVIGLVALRGLGRLGRGGREARSPRAASGSSRTTITTASARWPAPPRRPCPCGSSRTAPTATAPTAARPMPPSSSATTRSQALDGIRSWRDVRAPAVRAAIHQMDGLPLKPLFAKALAMGDELHNRPNALSALVGGALAPELVKAGVPTRRARRDALLAPLRRVPRPRALHGGRRRRRPSLPRASSTPPLVTAMARNGTEFGIRVSGLPRPVVHGPSPVVEGLFLPGYSAGGRRARHGRLGDHGDRRLRRLRARRRARDPRARRRHARRGGPDQPRHAEITLGTSPDYRMPAFGFEGAPVGIDIRKVVQTGILPTIDTAIAHREPGHPKIGGGIVRAPLAVLRRRAACVRRANTRRDDAAAAGSRAAATSTRSCSMRLAERLAAEDGVEDAAAMMGTPRTRRSSPRAASWPGPVDAGADDLIVAVEGRVGRGRRRARSRRSTSCSARARARRRAAPRTLDDAVALRPSANVAVISRAGRARRRRGAARARARPPRLPFSLQCPARAGDRAQAARRVQRGLLCMGPDCGTAIIAGKGLGFANAVRRGPGRRRRRRRAPGSRP